MKVILTAPVIAGFIALVLIYLFKNDIKGLLRRIATIKLPGGSELKISQSGRTEEEKAAPEITPVEPNLPSSIELSARQKEAVKNIFTAQRAEARLWEYRYLNYFFVANTQDVLDWLIQQSGTTTFSAYDSVWLAVIPNVTERTFLVETLRAYHMVETDGIVITVTPKGHEYANWRKPTPNNA